MPVTDRIKLGKVSDFLSRHEFTISSIIFWLMMVLSIICMYLMWSSAYGAAGDDTSLQREPPQPPTTEPMPHLLTPFSFSSWKKRKVLSYDEEEKAGISKALAQALVAQMKEIHAADEKWEESERKKGEGIIMGRYIFFSLACFIIAAFGVSICLFCRRKEEGVEDSVSWNHTLASQIGFLTRNNDDELRNRYIPMRGMTSYSTSSTLKREDEPFELCLAKIEADAAAAVKE